MKKFITLLTITCSFYGFGQTLVFDKNQEQAVTNEKMHVSKMMESTFKSDATIRPEEVSTLSSLMSDKKGYISITVSGNQIVVKHEDWMVTKDILDVLKVSGIIAIDTRHQGVELEKE